MIIKNSSPDSEEAVPRRSAQQALRAIHSAKSAAQLRQVFEAINEATTADYVDIFFTLGYRALEQGSLPLAVDAFAQTVSLDPERRWDAGQKLLTYVDEQEHLGFEDLVKIVAGLDAVEGFTVPDLEYALLRRLLDMPESPEQPNLVARCSRNVDVDRLLELGNACLGGGRARVALLAYCEAIKRQPVDLLTRLQIGVTYFLDGQYQEAERHFAILQTLGDAERRRWGVADCGVRVLHTSWTQAIGHIATIDSYIKAKKLGWLPANRTLAAFNVNTPPAGWQLLTFFAKHIEVLGALYDEGTTIDRYIFGKDSRHLSSHARSLRRTAISDFFWAGRDGEGRTRWYAPWAAAVQNAWRDRGRGPVVELEPEERATFRKTLAQAFGVPEEAWYVVLHVREGGYHAAGHRAHEGTRNARIETYQQAIDFIRDQGGYVVRGGDPSMHPIPQQDRVIDYATSPLRSPELDILLCADCRFFIGTNSGFSLVPPIFGRPCVLTNWSPIAIPNWYPDDIYIPKLIRHREDGRYQTFQEMFSSVTGWSQFARDFRGEWEIVDNEPEDLRGAVAEMHARLTGGATLGADDGDRIDRFHQIACANGGYVGSQPGALFLATYSDLLDDRPIIRSPLQRLGT